VRRFGLLSVIFLAIWVCPGSASAGVRALSAAGPSAAGPGLEGSAAVWAGAGSVLSSPVFAPTVAPGAIATAPARVDELVAGDGLVAVRSGDALFSGSARVLPDAGAPPLFPIVPSVQPTAAGMIVLEDDSAWLRLPGGRREEIALPPGGDPAHVAFAGALGVAPVPEGLLTFFSVPGGIEQRSVSLGSLDLFNPSGLAVSASGEVAAAMPVGDGTEAVIYAGPDDSRVRVLAHGLRFGRVAVSGGRVAFVTDAGLPEGMRVFVVDAATGQTVFRGPPAVDVTSVALDGPAVAWSTPSCLFVGTSSRFTVPVGPCLRTDIAVARVRGGVRVACVNAATHRCHVRSAGRVRYVPRGSARVVPGRFVRVIDADGRSAVVRP